MKNEIRICPRCGGTGKLKAMQLGISRNGKSQRVHDTEVKCKNCGGAGLILGDRKIQGMSK